MTTQRERMLAGELYDPFDPELVAARERVRDLLWKLNAKPAPERELLQQIFGRGGDSVWMQPPFYCDYGTNIECGERVFFNFNCVVLDTGKVTSGDYCQCGSGVQLLTPLHPLDGP